MDRFLTFVNLICVNFLLDLCGGVPVDSADFVVQRYAPSGDNVILLCRSNDRRHVFRFWHLVNRGVIIGPANNFDQAKFRYEILSGNLTIKGVSKDEEGLYECVSKAVNAEDLNIKKVQLLVETQVGSIYEDEYNLTLIKILIAMIFVILFAMAAFFIHSIWRDRFRYPRYLEEDDDESTEELFSAPPASTSKPKPNSHIVPKRKTVPAEFDDVDISTDFRSILDAANDE
ncbi:uncharacterized protein LOC132702445 [Cylas formicarius]|uniref:uncharacterized protein LOC132702445 n=1 Tax=Cylas formicarius TaxID=197179 RepID=UPI0029584E03|nr:uncharacterized protein LOC132702445 [Cylas formicarius]